MHALAQRRRYPLLPEGAGPQGAVLAELVLWMGTAGMLLHLFREPEPPYRAELPWFSRGEPVYERGPLLTVTAEGALLIDGDRLSAGSCLEHLAEINAAGESIARQLGRRRDEVVWVAADEQADTAAVRSALSCAREAGWPRVGLLGWRR